MDTNPVRNPLNHSRNFSTWILSGCLMHMIQKHLLVVSNSARVRDYRTPKGPAGLWKTVYKTVWPQVGALFCSGGSLPRHGGWRAVLFFLIHTHLSSHSSGQKPGEEGLKQVVSENVPWGCKLCFWGEGGLCGPPQLCLYPFDFQKKLFRVYWNR